MEEEKEIYWDNTKRKNYYLEQLKKDIDGASYGCDMKKTIRNLQETIKAYSKSVNDAEKFNFNCRRENDLESFYILLVKEVKKQFAGHPEMVTPESVQKIFMTILRHPERYYQKMVDRWKHVDYKHNLLISYDCVGPKCNHDDRVLFFDKDGELTFKMYKSLFTEEYLCETCYKQYKTWKDKDEVDRDYQFDDYSRLSLPGHEISDSYLDKIRRKRYLPNWNVILIYPDIIEEIKRTFTIEDRTLTEEQMSLLATELENITDIKLSRVPYKKMTMCNSGYGYHEKREYIVESIIRDFTDVNHSRLTKGKTYTFSIKPTITHAERWHVDIYDSIF